MTKDEAIRADMKLLQTFIDDSADEPESRAFYNMRAWIITDLHSRRTPVSGEVAEALAPTGKEECTLCDGMGMLDGFGCTCVHCNGSGIEPQIPAQGIDHAKLLEGERESFETEFSAKSGHNTLIRSGATYSDGRIHWAWQGWQARGQQAGGAEGDAKGNAE